MMSSHTTLLRLQHLKDAHRRRLLHVNSQIRQLRRDRDYEALTRFKLTRATHMRAVNKLAELIKVGLADSQADSVITTLEQEYRES